MKHPIAWIGVRACLMLIIGVTAAAAPDDVERQNSFKLLLTGKLESVAGAPPMLVGSETETHYTWRQKGPDRTLTYDLTRLKVTTNGKDETTSTMSRNHYAFRQGDKSADVDFEHAPTRLQEMLQSCYETPLCRIAVDSSGKETAREILATKPAQTVLVDKGAISNAVLFHSPFFAEKNEWKSPTSVNVDGKTQVEGDLTYTRTGVEKSLVTFKVEGTLTSNQSPAAAGSPITKQHITDVVSGTQSYDTALHEWVSGSWKLKSSLKMWSNEKVIVDVQGTIRAEFERLEPDKGGSGERDSK